MSKEFDELVTKKFAREIERISAESRAALQTKMADLANRNLRGGPTIAVYQQTELAQLEKLTRAKYRILKETHTGTGAAMTPDLLREFGTRSEEGVDGAAKRIHGRILDRFPDLKDIAEGCKSALESEVYSIKSRFRRDVAIEVQELSLKNTARVASVRVGESPHMNKRVFEFDVAISFAGEQRAEAEAIADCLRSEHIKVFYDRYEKHNLWGKDLYVHLDDVYQKKARYCLILISADYARKVWTTHEHRSAQARALSEKDEYILPVRFDDAELPGLRPTVGYLSFTEEGVQGICDLILKKLRDAASGTLAASQTAGLNVAKGVITVVDEVLDGRIIGKGTPNVPETTPQVASVTTKGPFAKIERLMPKLLEEMRKDLREHPTAREFVVLESGGAYNSDGFYLSYHLDRHEGLEGKLQILENLGFVRETTYNNVRRFVFDEHFVDYLTEAG